MSILSAVEQQTINTYGWTAKDMASTSDNNFLSSDQDINQFLV